MRDVILARLRRAEAPSWDWQKRCCGDGASVPAPERGLEENWSADVAEVPEARERPCGKLSARVPLATRTLSLCLDWRSQDSPKVESEPKIQFVGFLKLKIANIGSATGPRKVKIQNALGRILRGAGGPSKA